MTLMRPGIMTKMVANVSHMHLTAESGHNVRQKKLDVNESVECC